MNLNKVQQDVVEHNGSGLVFASAGTGKTFTLSTKIEYLLESKRYIPEEILCLTFTNRGCNEMIDKIKRKLNDDAKRITIKTFHAYCYELIKKFKLFSKNEIEDYIIYDEEDCKNICLLVKDEFDLPLNIIVNFISFCKQEIISNGYFNKSIYDSFIVVVNNLYKEKEKLNEYIRKTNFNFNENFTDSVSEFKALNILNIYEKTLEESYAYDFDDLEYYANVAIMDQLFLNSLQRKYKIIFIDEAQDTSFAEYKMIKKIGINCNVYLCGDFFQTIYEWRGSEPQLIINDFTNTFNPKVFVFNVNYRSTQTLSNACFGLLKNMFNDLVEKTYDCSYLSYNNNIGNKVFIKECSTIYDESIIINDLVDKNKNDNSTILVRTNQYAIELSRQLRILNPNKYFLVQDYQYYRRNEVKEIMAFLRLILNPYDTVSLERITMKYVKGFGEKKLSKILTEEAVNNGIRISDLLDIKTHLGIGNQYKKLTDKLQRNEIVIFDTETTGLKFGEDEIIQIAAIKINSNFEIIDKINILVKANKPVGDSYLVHGISDELLKEKGIDKIDALKQTMKFIGECIVIGHNVTFDISMLNAELSKVNLQLFSSDFYDTMLISKRYIRDSINYKLETLCHHLKLEHISTHDALDDVIATAYLLKYLYNNFIIPNESFRVNYIKPYLKLFEKLALKIQEFRELIYKLNFVDFIEKVISDLNIEKIYKDSNDAIFNINHFKYLINVVIDPSLDTYNALREIVNISSLTTSDFDAIYKSKHLIPIITVHQSKGCEFENVYIAGAYDDMFPSFISKKIGRTEEEKRLFYVAVTRAKEGLFITYPRENLKGFIVKKSPFIDYFDEKYLNIK